jgi:hypothetical protein
MRTLSCRSVPLALVLLVLSPAVALADPLPKEAQRCLAAINEKSLKLAKILGKEQARCLRAAGRDALGGQTLEECLAADPKGKVARAASKLASKAEKLCENGPPFGNQDGAFVEQIVRAAEAVRMHDLFGPDLAAAVPVADPDSARQRCRESFSAQSQRCAEAILGHFAKCKKSALRDRVDPAMSEQDLVDRCFPGHLFGGFNPIPETVARECLGGVLESLEPCEGQDVGSVFPPCAGRAPVDCVEERAYCRACRALEAVDGLPLDCDRFDDGMGNLSCDVACTDDSAATVCDFLPHTSPTCVADSCAPGSCDAGWCNYFDRWYDGCESRIDGPGDCQALFGFASLSGDEPSSPQSVVANAVLSGYWFAVDVDETDPASVCEPICLRVEVVPPPGMDYDLELYCEQCPAGAPAVVSSTPGDAPEVAHIVQFEPILMCDSALDNAIDLSRTIFGHLVYRSSNVCGPIQVTVTGDVCGAPLGNCPAN